MDAQRYNEFLVESCLGGNTFELQILDGGTLIGVGILDRIKDAVSSVYFYFDPGYAHYSPGTYSALREIELAKELGALYYYLGFYIRDCGSMSYKTRFRPCEHKAPAETAWTREA